MFSVFETTVWQFCFRRLGCTCISRYGVGWAAVGPLRELSSGGGNSSQLQLFQGRLEGGAGFRPGKAVLVGNSPAPLSPPDAGEGQGDLHDLPVQ